MALTLTGAAGSVRWSYHRAAVFQRWSLSPVPQHTKTFALKATLGESDAFVLTRRPLTVHLDIQGRTWDLDLVDEPQVNESVFTATVKPQERA